METRDAVGPDAGLPQSVRLGLPAAVFVVAFACFQPALSADFLLWDDEFNFLLNRHYRGFGAEQIQWMFTTLHRGHYHPLTWLTAALDHAVWGMWAPGYHLTNLLLHAGNAVLFFIVILALLRAAQAVRTRSEEITVRIAAAAGALLFAIHPLRVESVAWITERRDVLSAAFFLLTILAYLRMQREAGGRRTGWYVVSIACALLSLLSKAWAVTLPVVLLILDAYPLGRLAGPDRGRALLEKIPYAALAVAAGIVATIAQQAAGATASLLQHTPVERIVQASYGLFFYLAKSLVPLRLSPLYPIDRELSLGEPLFLVCVAGVVAVTVWLAILRRRWPAGLASWASYAVIVSPVLGIAQSGPQLAADRYTYLACLPWALLAAAGMRRLWLTNESGALSSNVVKAAGATAGALLVVLGVLTFMQTRVWKDTLTLWEHAVKVDPANYAALAHRGDARFMVSDFKGAIEDFDASLRIGHAYAPAYASRGLARYKTGELRRALEDYDEALRLVPRSPNVRANRGVARRAAGDLKGALEDFDEAIRLDAETAEAYGNRGALRYEMKDGDGAAADFDTALRLNPEYTQAYLGRARLRESRGDLLGARADVARALDLTPAEWPLRKSVERSFEELDRRINNRGGSPK